MSLLGKPENRQYVRHEARVPLEVTVIGAPASVEGIDVSAGGLAFLIEDKLYPGELISLKMPTVVPVFEATARVAWCREEGVRFRVGVAFVDAQDAQRAQMVEQVCAIERYRMEAMKKGRRLTTSQAAAELQKRSPLP
jgi:hypothetical protein